MDRGTYIADTPVLPEGFRWLRIELKRSVIWDSKLEFALMLPLETYCDGYMYLSIE